MTGGERLEREKCHRKPQITLAVPIEVRVQRRQRERNPLDRRDVDLRSAEEARRRERENEPAYQRAGHAETDTTPEDIRSESAQDARQQGHDVQREGRVPGPPENGRREHGAADQVLGVGERVVKRVGIARLQKRLQVGNARQRSFFQFQP